PLLPHNAHDETSTLSLTDALPISKPAYSHELPAMDGNHLRVFVSDIEVASGESSPPHSHPCAVIGHVAAGAFRHQVKGEPEAVRSEEHTSELQSRVDLVCLLLLEK